MNALAVDLLLDPFGARWTDLRDAARAAADVGFAGLWTYDHVDGHVYAADHVLECWTVLTALAVDIPTVPLGPMVMNVANRPPTILAAMAATLQHVSGGRLLLGLGAGAHPGTPYAREQEVLRLPVRNDAERRLDVTHAVADLHRMWESPGFLRPDPAPPVIIAAFGPKMAELAGRVGDGINTRANHPHLADLVTTARDAHAALGRDPDAFLVTVFADFAESWLAAGSPVRAELDALGVHRLVLAMGQPFDREQIAASGRRLGG
jgi:alkanesulfonate monooxygenase SsuD/methylene tetrahydromethanopterin reductase-like flavin-dependent oxidoreductase (luciferase family)